MTRSFRSALEELELDLEADEPPPSRFSHCPGETAALLGYALNTMTALDHTQPEVPQFIRWLASKRVRFGVGEKEFEGLRLNGRQPTSVTPLQWAKLRKVLLRRHQELRETTGPAAAGLAAVCRALGLEAMDAALLGIIFRYRTDNDCERLFDLFSMARGRTSCLRRYSENFAIMLNQPQADVAKRFLPSGALTVSGSIRLDEDGDIMLPDRLRSLIYACGETGESMRAQLLGAPRQAHLPWTAFSHLGEDSEIARALLGAVLDAQGTEAAVHILLYGPPGTGKTEFAATLAKLLGAPLYVIGEADAHGEEPNRSERMNDLLMAQRVSGGERALYLFDEAEDIFRTSPFERSATPKIFIHRLMESARVPVIWAANDITAFSSAVLRRMSLCLEVKLPERSRRAELWCELAEAEGVALDEPMAQDLAGLIPTAPAVARNALRAARLAGGEARTATRVARGLAKAMGHGVLPAPEAAELPGIYDPAYSRADLDLAALVARLTRPGAPRGVSLLLSGPPGTGKSAFARHLAAAMGLGVLQKRGSDIFGSYVGETERNIAAAFAQARDEGKFLIFDEADSLLGGRERAVRNWEVSQVNEMLTWMETHPQPFVCTTNLPEGLDAASLRRFLLHVRFDYLAPAQTARLFAKTFTAPAPERLATLDRLTPADFSRVAKRMVLLDDSVDAARAFSLLAAEMESRLGPARGMGFGRLM
ncbi:AAA family ATPase [Acidocella aromatica]|uniref:SpoVK/Ycf46/Vps4 family AAA+-type ATPase n=1 Tax=Acidocella aromatica TaxID=1303579 RepID=A0A840VFI1_9PROT|nr:ATP-binding protein [Acidocella aromatica]MBB5374456.1 SpoVK/Ycf46/Vps4 family AAA+-type ATPase [Acidocella aromatica]